MRTSSWLSYRVILGVVALSGLVVTASVRAGPVEGFTGYTRIGDPPLEGKGDPKIKLTAEEAKGIGVTVYFMVLDRRAPVKGKVHSGDTFGLGVENADRMFVPSRTSDRGKLDTEARYLYLYQVVNDSRRDDAARDVAVRLIVDPRYITSVGHFRDEVKKEKAKGTFRIGLGFAIVDKNADKNKADGVPTVLPVSTERQVAPRAKYLNPAPAVTVPENTYAVTRISIGQRAAKGGDVAPAILAAAGEDEVGKEPTTVSIVYNARFRSAVANSTDFGYIRPLGLSDVDALPGEGAPRGRLRDDWKNRFPAVKAFFNEDPVGRRQRSTIFGFTSNLGPVKRETAVTPLTPAEAKGAAKGGEESKTRPTAGGGTQRSTSFSFTSYPGPVKRETASTSLTAAEVMTAAQLAGGGISPAVDGMVPTPAPLPRGADLVTPRDQKPVARLTGQPSRPGRIGSPAR